MTLLEGIIERVLLREGTKFVVETMTCSKFGTTREKLAEWRKAACTCDDVKALTKEEAISIYVAMLHETRIADLSASPALCEVMFDTAVNCGPGRAARWLQQACGAEDDGQIGPETLMRVARCSPRVLFASVLDSRVQHHGRIVTANPDKYARYAGGWAVRCGEFVRLLALPDGPRWGT